MTRLFFLALFYSVDLINGILSFIMRAGKTRRSNYIYNMKIPGKEKIVQRGYIGNQFRLSEFRYGVCPLDFNGCGAVAVYNILYFHNRVRSFVKLLHNLEKSALALGYLGSSPIALSRFLKSRGFVVKTVFTKMHILNEDFSGCSVIHFIFRSDFSGHFVAGIPEYDGAFRFYNSSVPSDISSSISEYIDKTERKNKEKNHPVIFHCMLLIYNN